MKMFVAVAAALPTLAATLPMFVSLGTVIASRYRSDVVQALASSRKSNSKDLLQV